VRLTGVTLDDELRPSFRLESSRGSFEVQLELRGEHQADNAALAAAAALELGAAPVEIADGFASVSGASWRMQVTRTTDELVIVNDAYNANPTAMTAALRAFGALQVPGRRIAVLGEMLDLGSEAATAHSDVGRQVAASGVHILVVVGRGLAPMANAARDAGDETLVVVEVDHVDAAHVEVAALLQPGDAVLVKASRAVGLERVAELLLTAGASS
jgi:UDP-N-acetylmuramoyl-tripeptide--D-alanyl-D-alanine ligase